MRASRSGLRARVLQVVAGRQRLHHRRQIVRPELVDEAGERLAQRQRDLRPLVDVIVVQEDREQPDVVAGGLEHRVLASIESPAARSRSTGRGAVDLDELHRLHRLRHAVVGDLEVGHRQDRSPARRRGRSRSRRRGRDRCRRGRSAAGAAVARARVLAVLPASLLAGRARRGPGSPRSTAAGSSRIARILYSPRYNAPRCPRTSSGTWSAWGPTPSITSTACPRHHAPTVPPPSCGSPVTARCAAAKWRRRMAACAALGPAGGLSRRVGSDDNGRLISSELAGRGVDLSHVVTRECANRFAVITVDDTTGERIVLWDRDERLNAQPSRSARRRLIASARLVHVDDEDQEAAIAAALLAREAGVPVTSDIDRDHRSHARNWSRPSAFRSSPSTSCRRSPAKPTASGRCARCAGSHAGLLCVTLGAARRDAARGRRADALSRGSAVTAVDTTGAGDVFRAAFIYGLLNRHAPRRHAALRQRRGGGVRARAPARSPACRRCAEVESADGSVRQRFAEHAAHRVGQRHAGQERQRRRQVDRRGRLRDTRPS